jgi:hypothetical protein
MAADVGRRGRKWIMENRIYEILARKVEERYFELLQNSTAIGGRK